MAVCLAGCFYDIGNGKFFVVFDRKCNSCEMERLEESRAGRRKCHRICF